MVRLLRPANRSGIRPAYYVAGYWVLNIALVAAEAKWHLIYRLTLWDITQLRMLAPLFARMVHVGVIAVISTHA